MHRKAPCTLVLAGAVGLLSPTLRIPYAFAADAVELAGHGRPEIVLDRLTLPDRPGMRHLERHLRRVLRREARRVDWGVGRGHRIEYRFTVEKLELVERGGVLHLRCEALGRLPKSKSARSKLSFGASPAERTKATQKILEIVARGVMTRLAELERARRGAAPESTPNDPMDP